jgi:hypothetical protein
VAEEMELWMSEFDDSAYVGRGKELDRGMIAAAT